MPSQNIALYPWFKFTQNLLFWQAIWFLYFQQQLSASEAIALYAVYDISTTVLEVPSGYMSDRLGRRRTLIFSAVAAIAGMAFIAFGDSFTMFAMGQLCLGASIAFASGTDTALLYESLVDAGRADEVEEQELRAWRFTFAGLAISAVTGGAMALYAPALPFLASALAFAGMLFITLRLSEPQRRRSGPHPALQLGSLGDAIKHPVLCWLFALAVLMYGFSHLPFVFGQPFILSALSNTGLAAQTPLVSGGVSAIMMLLSVAVSLVALGLRNRIGLTGILLLAFAMQIALAGVLSLTTSALAIAFLFLRMVPNALSQPFILARIQPLLPDDSRATYLSVQSLVGRLVFAASLLLAAGSTTAAGEMPAGDIQRVLGWYAIAGLFCLVGLALAARRITMEPST